MYKYIYDGPVMEFGRCISNRWTGETYAVSKQKALSNLAHQFKKHNNLLPSARVVLPGKVRIERKEQHEGL